MKAKHTNLSTQFFNFRLFLEGLKRLRVIGLATAILAITASALVPIVCWIEQEAYYDTIPYEMETEFLCVPAGLAVVLAPFFFFVLFSFLQKRKESDFFHAIPYTRTCVYVSFVTAALTFVWVIQLACALTAGSLWAVNPMVIADVGGMVSYALVSMLAAAMLSAFMMLALTVSGTGSSCILLFVLFAGFVRVVAAIFLGCLDNIMLLPTNDMWNHSVLSPLWFLPISVIYYMGEYEIATAIMYSLPNILYSVLVTVAVFALAGIIYKHRRSEMAGNPASGVRTQALFRVMFTVLLALLIPLMAISDADEPGLMLVLVVGVLLVYFLYELITTKRAKNMLKAIPGLGIVAGICIVFTVLFYAYRGAVLYEDITKDEVKTVSVDSNGFGNSTYQDGLLGDLRTDDPEIISTVVNRLAFSQKFEREGGWKSYDSAVIGYQNRFAVTIHMKGGRTLQRYILMDDKIRDEINARYMTLEEVREIALLLPEDHEIINGGVELGYPDIRMDYCHLEDTEAVMAIFRREFATLTEEQKREVMFPTLDYFNYHGCGVTLSLRGTIDGNGRRFFSDYLITEALPETRAYLVALWGVSNQDANYYDTSEQSVGGSADEVLTALAEDAKDPEFTGTFGMLKGNIVLVGMGNQSAGKGHNSNFFLEAKDYDRFTELMSEASLIHADTEIEDFTLTDHTYMLIFHTEMDGKYTNMYISMYTLLHLPPEAYQELIEILLNRQ